jgi:hypothetical protein
MSDKKLKQCLIFGGGTKTPDYDQIEEQLDELDKKRDVIPSEEKEIASAYVQVFESMSIYLFEEGTYAKIGFINSHGPDCSEMRVRSTLRRRDSDIGTFQPLVL